jgi:hypothetical protein
MYEDTYESEIEDGILFIRKKIFTETNMGTKISKKDLKPLI